MHNAEYFLSPTKVKLSIIWKDLFTFLQVIVGLLGMVGNSMAIYWFSRKKIQRNFHQLMFTLAIYDMFYIVISLIIFGLPNLYPG